MAERRGLHLEKSKRRDPHAVDYGTYQLIDPENNSVVSLGGGPLTIDQAEAQLLGLGAFYRAGPGEHVDAEAGSVVTVKPGAVLDVAIGGRKLIAQWDGSLRELSADELAEEKPAGTLVH